MGKGNISEEIVEVSSVFIHFFCKRRNVVLPLQFNLFTLLLGYTQKQYIWQKKTMMELTHHCLFYFAFCFTFYFASYINHSSEC
ncbi:hypothetical protein COE20_18255 [Bacillus cereus]|nr:hypothetical protein CON03_11290 [Bacillus cereus]PFE44406.1 hypothetical protein CN317_21260 [Bacillus cereus]PFN14274.1 hypothetical protein COJ72_17625 [Bacillus cereus]PGY26435.1 hypothetical protein COE20_18255 [Bacillus cereus]